MLALILGPGSLQAVPELPPDAPAAPALPAPAPMPGPPMPAPAVPPVDDVIELDEFQVVAETMDLEEEVEEHRLWSIQAEPGSIFADVLYEQMQSREEFGGLDELVEELGELEPPSLGAGSGARAPRGFTTPRLREGFTQQGFPEIITPGKREIFSGMLATFFGRTAPGGIVNVLPYRPANRKQHRMEFTGTTQPRAQVRLNSTGTIIRRRLTYRVLTEAFGLEGPVDYQRQSGAIGTLRMRWRKNPWMVFWDLEAGGRGGVPGNGIPHFRESVNEPVVGPYFPLAGFSLHGPQASFYRRSLSSSVVAQRRFGDNWVLRAGAQAWTRSMQEHRFRNGQYLLDQQIFAGVREPQYTEVDQSAVSASAEVIGLIDGEKFKHRILAGVESSFSDRFRGQYLLPTAVRNALPTSVRSLDPANPDYTMIPYDPTVYTRALVNREESTHYTGVYLSERVSFGRGRHHATAGVRWDQLTTKVNDLRSNAPVRRAERTVDRATYHIGGLSEVVRGQLAVFLNTSTAFQPTERVDIRTGVIQGNESTSGVEAGFRAQTRDRRVAASLGLYQLRNRDITRTNPLFEDPVADPDGAQPQLLSSGSERFTGAELITRWIPANRFAVTSRIVWTEAITTASPDLPNEVGQQIAGVPEWHGALTIRQTFDLGERRFLGWRARWNVIGAHIARHESTARQRIDYPAFSTFDLSMDYSWRGDRRHRIFVLVRNLTDRDTATVTGRLGRERRLEGRYSVVF